MVSSLGTVATDTKRCNGYVEQLLPLQQREREKSVRDGLGAVVIWSPAKVQIACLREGGRYHVEQPY